MLTKFSKINVNYTEITKVIDIECYNKYRSKFRSMMT